MIRNFQMSKQTQDKVKLAKIYIQSKYRAILQKQQQNRLGWQKIMKALAQAPLAQSQKSQIVQKAFQKESSQIRQIRIKDSLLKYQLLKIIGKGAFGLVCLAKSKQTGEIVAIKRIEKQKLLNRKQVASVYLQRQCLARTRSKWLVELKSTFQDQKYLYIVMQWVPGGDLLRLLIQKDIFTQTQTKFYMAQLILAIQDMHNSNFIHRDIKPDNILIDKKGHIKLTDFGLSKHHQIQNSKKMLQSKDLNQSSFKKLKGTRERYFSKVGTPDYIAPQILTANNYDQKVDIWSAGVIMFQCLFGYPPFCHEDSHIVCNKVANWQEYLVFPDQPKVNYQAKLLIVGMLNHPDKRLSIKQIKNHVFFQGVDWNNVKKMKAPFVPQLKHDLDTNNFDNFQQQGYWSIEETTLNRSNSAFKANCTFAGFDWHPEPQNNNLNHALKQIHSMSSKKLKLNQNKRLLTQMSNCQIGKQSKQKYKHMISTKKAQSSKANELTKRPINQKYRI